MAGKHTFSLFVLDGSFTPKLHNVLLFATIRKFQNSSHNEKGDIYTRVHTCIYRDAQICYKSRSHLKFLGGRMVT